ncbi:DHH family phosphoesterase [Hespellia stercorisuis]|uniref:Phosphoesterase RecJ domain-containing protein n=1 Tax=Hespellia stercorisuis DSM 15480 TaxID=1121950 RepID=A0A1M6HPV3_9FIRM|nr:bifunctional oligoribonuclease/PAP phosphatase NrnA [Hespellia stercorisuis]SHJ24255.1 phosphoesterase RecJ domain-containing protein [Hespellia stercorisuis DSM 15480]
MRQLLQEVIQGKRSVAIGGHVRPDGDCVGSCMGLFQYLKDNCPEINVDVYLEDIPDPLRFIEATKEIRHEIDPEQVYDLFICLDCGDIGRLGFSGPLFSSAGDTLCVDHHISNQAFAAHNYIVPDASSTSELIYNLIDPEKITKEIAEALYVGIAHDTGVFLYSCTKPSTMEAAAQLLRTGIDANDIIDKTYYEKTYVQNQILGRALLESMLLLDKRCIVSVVTKKELEFYNATAKDLDGIVSQLRSTKGVDVAMFLYETDTQEFKVSLRSNGAVDVSVIAQYFGGGGHKRAAGFTLSGRYHDIINNVTRQIELQL